MTGLCTGDPGGRPGSQFNVSSVLQSVTHEPDVNVQADREGEEQAGQGKGLIVEMVGDARGDIAPADGYSSPECDRDRFFDGDGAAPEHEDRDTSH